jgi:O-antigen ligase
VPILAVTAYFTFSRGAFLALAIALVVFLVTARSRGLPGTMLATVPATFFAVHTAYGQDELAGNQPDTALGASQGEHVMKVLIVWAVVAAVIRVLTIFLLDRRVGQIEMTPERRRRGWIAAGATTLCAIAAALALGAPGWIDRQYDGFAHGPPPNDTTGDLRLRLTDPSSNGRIDHWEAAVHEFGDETLHGNGAGTYEFAWAERRDSEYAVVDAHSLYLEVMGELGIVGLLLIVATVVGLIAGVAARLRGENRVLYAGLLAAVVAWAVHAGVDWDWEMPAVTAWVFAAGGGALAARSGRSKATTTTAQRSRIPVAAALLIAAATPVLLLFSQTKAHEADDAFRRGECAEARTAATKSIDALSIRPEPYRLLGFCNIQEGRPEDAVEAMTKALDKSRGSWQSHYGLAMALAAAGRDPRPEIRQALELNPLEAFVKRADRAFRTTPTPDGWRRAVPQNVDDALRSGQLAFD